MVCFIGEKSSRVIRIAFYDQPMLGCDQYPFDGCVEDEYGEMLCPLGFYEMESYYDDEPKNYRIDNVTHWQPLPPLPEE